MKVFIKEPNASIERCDINNDLATLQKIVGGYIETVTLGVGNAVVICNEEGRYTLLSPNCVVITTKGVTPTFLGTIIIAGIDGEDFADCDAVVSCGTEPYTRVYVHE